MPKMDRIPHTRMETRKSFVGKVGIKFDSDKARWDLLPWLALECVAIVMRDGGIKYDEHNWRRGLHYSRLLRGAIGHIAKHLMGELYDRQTNLPHLAHAACCVLFVLEYFLITRVTGGYDKWNNLLDHGEKVNKEYASIDMFRNPETRKTPI